MSIYLEMPLIAVTVSYIVDVSGFTESWKGALQRWLGIGRLRSMKPLDCSQCMTWWACLAFALCTGHFSLPVVAYAALMGTLSVAFTQLLLLMREALCAALRKLTEIADK